MPTSKATTRAEIYALLSGITDPEADGLPRRERPDPRRPRRPDEVTYRLHAGLKGARPLRWRRLDVASSLMLDEVHAVLQAAFGFEDYHLHRFSVGGGPYDERAAHYLCAWDVEEGEADGVDEREVRLDELLASPGDRLAYVYDFGDDWEITLKLEKVLPRGPEDPRAACVGGRGGDVPEDSGGVWGLQELAEAGDIDEFDLEATDDAVRHALDRPPALPPLVAALVARLDRDDEAAVRALAEEADLRTPLDLDAGAAARVVHRYRWLVERLGADGVQLTGAGHLPPALVKELMTELQLDPRFIGSWNREDLTPPAAIFREAAAALGLVRKVKGRLTVPAAVRKLAGDPVGLLGRVASALPVGKEGSAEHDAGLVALMWTAAGRNPSAPELATATLQVLGAAGWRLRTGALQPSDARELAMRTVEVLRNAGTKPGGIPFDAERAPDDVVLLARTALLTAR